MKKRLSICLILSLLCTSCFPAFANNNEVIESSSAQEAQYNIETININMAENLLDEYYINLTGQEFSIDSSEVNAEIIENFVETQVTNNIIPDTQEASAALSKEAYRAIFMAGAESASAMFPIASYLLKHSLTDNPSDVTYPAGSYTSNEVFSSAVVQNLIEKAIAVIQHNATGSFYTYRDSGSFNYSSYPDLGLAIGKFNFTTIATKPSTVWTYSYTLTDVYNYDPWPNVTSAIGKMNNIAAEAQSAGAITPFNVTIYPNIV